MHHISNLHPLDWLVICSVIHYSLAYTDATGFEDPQQKWNFKGFGEVDSIKMFFFIWGRNEDWRKVLLKLATTTNLADHENTHLFTNRNGHIFSNHLTGSRGVLQKSQLLHRDELLQNWPEKDMLTTHKSYLLIKVTQILCAQFTCDSGIKCTWPIGSSDDLDLYNQ